MNFDEYVALYQGDSNEENPEEKFYDWVVDNCPFPTNEELQQIYEELEVEKWD